MIRVLLYLCSLLLAGCGFTPEPESQKEVALTQTIQTNISDAQKAQEEYQTLQYKRNKTQGLTLD
ncbi:MAG: hypothetical protein IE885_08540 [Campylobacterales bacterium]|nr:hypothetical protein [Campylobacterales bacterium]